jgi:hypothetical protein
MFDDSHQILKERDFLQRNSGANLKNIPVDNMDLLQKYNE